MDRPRLLQQQLDVLAYGEVQPLLFATDVERTADVAIHVMLIDPTDGVDASGHSSTSPVFSRRFATADGLPVTDGQITEWRARTISEFGARLRELLVEEHPAG